MSEEKKSKVNASVLEMAKAIANRISIDDAGIGSVKDDPYRELMPDGVTPEVVAAVSNYNSTFIAASAKAFGEIAMDAMEKNNKLNRGSIEIEMEKDGVKHIVDREGRYPNPTGGAEIVKHGVVSTAFTVQAGRKVGQLKSVREELAELGAMRLSSK